jgi:hypothetical protein
MLRDRWWTRVYCWPSSTQIHGSHRGGSRLVHSPYRIPFRHYWLGGSGTMVFRAHPFDRFSQTKLGNMGLLRSNRAGNESAK